MVIMILRNDKEEITLPINPDDANRWIQYAQRYGFAIMLSDGNLNRDYLNYLLNMTDPRD